MSDGESRKPSDAVCSSGSPASVTWPGIRRQSAPLLGTLLATVIGAAISLVSPTAKGDERIHSLGDLADGPLAYRSGRWGLVGDIGVATPELPPLKNIKDVTWEDGYLYGMVSVGGPGSRPNLLWSFVADGGHQPRLDNGGYWHAHGGGKGNVWRWDKGLVPGLLFGLQLDYAGLYGYKKGLNPDGSEQRGNRHGIAVVADWGYKWYGFGLYGGLTVEAMVPAEWGVEGRGAASWFLHGNNALRSVSARLAASQRRLGFETSSPAARHMSIGGRLTWRSCSRITWRTGLSFEIDRDVAETGGYGVLATIGGAYLNSDFRCIQLSDRED